MKNKINPFNNPIETGLRILCILNEAYPQTFDIQFLVYLDYLTVHSGDFDTKIKSIHPAVPYRTGELFVRSSLIRDGLELFTIKQLVDKIYKGMGIEYGATEDATPFLESLETKYILQLIEKAKWVVNNFASYKHEEMKRFFYEQTENINNEFNVEILS